MNLSPLPLQKFFDNAGRPLNGGLLFTYIAGTSTKLATYTDSSGGTPNTNPVVLNFRGEANVWLDQTLTYKFVLARENDTDPPTNPIWSVDNISSAVTYASLTALIIGSILYPISLAELAAGLTNADLNLRYPYGDVQRYKADPTGIADSATAWSNAIKANDYVFDGYPGGGKYLFNSTVVITRYPVRIVGAAQNIIDAGNGGTVITLATAAGSSAAALQTTAFTRGVRIENLHFTFQTFSTGQIGIRFAECRSGKIFGCSFLGLADAATTVVGVRFDGTGTFTGDTTVRDCYFTVLFKGVLIRGTCTTVRIEANEFSGNLTIPNAYAIEIGNLGETANTSFGLAITDNTFEAWTRGIYSTGQAISQVGNYYEANTAPWEWVRGNGNTRIDNQSHAEKFITAAAPIYPFNDVDACQVVSGGNNFFDRASVNARRGYFERGRSVGLGVATNVAYASGNFTANGGATWTVDSGDQSTFQYEIHGTTMIVTIVLVSTSTSVASPTQLIIAMPTSAQAQKTVTVPCVIVISGTREIAYASIASGSNLLAIQRLAGGSYGTVSNAIDVSVQIAFETNT